MSHGSSFSYVVSIHLLHSRLHGEDPLQRPLFDSCGVLPVSLLRFFLSFLDIICIHLIVLIFFTFSHADRCDWLFTEQTKSNRLLLFLSSSSLLSPSMLTKMEGRRGGRRSSSGLLRFPRSLFFLSLVATASFVSLCSFLFFSPLHNDGSVASSVFAQAAGGQPQGGRVGPWMRLEKKLFLFCVIGE